MSKLLKWSGSKDTQSNEIIERIPDVENYYEMFVGGGSVFLKLLETENNIKNYYISDINEDLINIYRMIQLNPKDLIKSYKEHYINFNSSDIQHRKDYFAMIRTQYNDLHFSSDFYWIMRTTTNGMPRYNKKQEFNNSCHFSRSGMHYDKVETLINKYNKLFNNNNVSFSCIGYDDIDIKENSVLYLDPPYENTKGMYFDNFRNDDFIGWLNKRDSKWLLSYDGKVNDKNIEHNAPKHKEHILLTSGNSSFRRVIGNSKDSIVYESLYLNY